MNRGYEDEANMRREKERRRKREEAERDKTSRRNGISNETRAKEEIIK